MAEMEGFIREDNVTALQESCARGTCSESGATELILLSCKYGSINSLTFLLDFCKINRISIDLDYLDENSHGMFYYAIRSNNWKLLITLIDKWPDEVLPKNSKDLYKLLSNSYNELKLKRFNLTDEMKCLLESRLLSLGTDSTNVPCSDRGKTVVECIEFLNSLESSVNEVFLHAVEFVAKNIHVLKRQMKSTYNVLPWEEMEFCLVVFLLSKNRQKECNEFYCYTLSPDVLVKHLNSFGSSLRRVLSEGGTDDANASPPTQRQAAVENVLRCNPAFAHLYRDFWVVRDIYSLENIDYYIGIAVRANPRTNDGQLVILRALQVIGENLKNSLESPKLSDSNIEILSISLPYRTRQFVMEIRNKLSHNVKQFDNYDLFKGLKNDLKKIGNSLTTLRQSMKLKIFLSILRKIEKLDDQNKIYNEIDKIINCMDKAVEDVKTMTYYVNHERQVVNEFRDVAETLPRDPMIDQLVQQIQNEIESSNKVNIDYYESLLDLVEFFKCVTDERNSHRFGVLDDTGDSRTTLIKNYLNRNKDCRSLEDFLNNKHSSKESKSKYVKGQSKNDLNHLIGLLIDAVETSRVKSVKFHEWVWKIINLKCIHSANVDSVVSLWTKLTKSKNEKKIKFVSNEKPLAPCSTREKVLRLKNVLKERCFENEHQLLERLHEYKNQREFHVLLEVLLLDVMSSLESGSYKVPDNISSLDNNQLVLTGKCLRNHLAHGNPLYSILVPDVNVTYLLNAIHMRHEPLGFQVHSRTLNLDLADKFHQDVEIIKRQNLMHQNLRDGKLDELNKNVKLRADLLGCNLQQESSLHSATKSNDIETVKFTYNIVQNGINLNDGDNYGQTVLHISSSCGNDGLVDFYLNLGANTNCTNAGKLTPLQLAALNGHLNIVKLLINRGAHCKQSVSSPLSLAVFNNHIDVVGYLSQELKGFHGYPLHLAARKGYKDLVDLLLEGGYNVHITNASGLTALDEAASNCRIEILKLLIEKGADVNRKGADGWSALHYAAQVGNEETVLILLDNHCSIEDVVDCHGFTPLHVAAMQGHARIIETLVERGAEVDVCDSKRVTPLHLALVHSQTESALKLIELDANVKLETEDGFTPLYLASENGLSSVGQTIINRGADVNGLTSFGVAPLHGSCTTNSRSFVEILLSNNAEVNIKDFKGSSPLHLTSDVDIVKLLISKGADINGTDDLGCTPLFHAVIHDSIDVVEILIKSGAEVNAEDKFGRKPLSYAVNYGFDETAELLLKNKSDVNFGDESVLFLAIFGSQVNMVNKLLGYKANVNHFQKGLSMLQIAVRFNQVPIIKQLINNGATDDGRALVDALLLGNLDSVKLLTDRKLKQNLNTPEILRMTVGKKDTGVLKYLLTKGLDVNMNLEEGSALHLAACKGFTDVVAVLLDSGASADCRDREARTPLHLACRHNQEDIIDILLRSNAQKNVQDSCGRTPVYIAAMTGNIDIARKLIASNVDLTIKDTVGSNLLHAAAYSGRKDLAQLFVNNGVDDKLINEKGAKPIHIAIALNHVDLVRYLLSNDQLYQRDNEKQSLLHHAARIGSTEMLRFLIKEKNFDPNYFNDDNKTALFTAAYHGNEAALKYLLENGAYFDTGCSGSDDSLPPHTRLVLTSTSNLFNAVRKNDLVKMKEAVDKGAVVSCWSAKFGTPLHYVAWKGFRGAARFLSDRANSVDSTDKNKCRPIHFASKYCHFDIVKLLLSKGCVFDAATASNKTPVDLATSPPILNLLNLIDALFRKVNNKDESFINDLKSMGELDMALAVLNANNTHRKTIPILVFQNNMKSYEEMTFLFQEDSQVLLDRARQFSSLGNHDKALRLYETVLSDRSSVFGRNSPPCWDVRLLLADQYLFKNNCLCALNQLDDVRNCYNIHLGQQSKQYLKCSSFIALVLFKMGLIEDSLDMIEDIEDQYESLDVRDDDNINNILLEKAKILTTYGKFQEALDITKMVFEKCKQRYGLYHTETVVAYNNYAVLLNNCGRARQSLRAIEEVIKINTILSGEYHPDTLRSKVFKIDLLRSTGGIEEALEQCYRLLATQTRILGEKHQDVIFTTCLLGDIHGKTNNTPEAYLCYKRALDTARVSLDEDHPFIPQISAIFNSLQKTLNFMGEENRVKLIFLSEQRRTMEAIHNNNIDELRELIKGGIGVNGKDIYGRTGLHLASETNNIDVINILLESGADITAVSCSGETALHLAVKNKNGKIAEILIKNCPNQNLQELINCRINKCLNTALHLACGNNMFDTVRLLLLFSGADFEPLNVNFKKPIDCSDDESILRYLQVVSDVFESVRDRTPQGLDLLKNLSENDRELFDCVVNCRNRRNLSLVVVALKSDVEIAKRISSMISG